MNNSTNEEKMDWKTKSTEVVTEKGGIVKIIIKRQLIDNFHPEIGYSKNFMIEWDTRIDGKDYNLNDPRIISRVPFETQKFLSRKTDDFLREIGLKETKEKEESRISELHEYKKEEVRIEKMMTLNNKTF